MRGLMRRSEQQQNNKSDLVSPAIVPVSNPTTSFIANCVDVLYDEGMAVLDCAKLGQNARIPFDPTCGIRKGAAVRVSVASNVPRVTAVLNFGSSETCVFDPAPEEDKPFFKIQKPSGTGEFEEATADISGVKLEDSEKVLACEFSGIKAGLTYSTLFYGANARIFCESNTVSVLGDYLYFQSRGGVLTIDPPDKNSSGKEKMGSISEKVYRYEEEEVFEFIREYKGNVSNSMGDDNFYIKALPGSSGMSISNLAYLFVILDKDVDKYKKTYNKVSHRYLNRELKVDGDGDNPVNEELSSKMNLSDEFLEDGVLIAKAEDIDVVVVYLKGVSLEGDLYEFNAGENISLAVKRKQLTMETSESAHFGEENTFFQLDSSTIQYPAMESTTVRKEIYGNNIQDIKGDEYTTNHRKRESTQINTNTKYEVDIPSGIETRETRRSPIVENRFQKLTTIMTKEDGITDDNVSATEIMRHQGATLMTKKDPTASSSFLVSHSGEDESSIMTIGPGGFQVQTPRDCNIEASTMRVDTETNTFEGKTFFGKGIYVKGDLTIQADNIFMEAAEDIFMSSLNLGITSSNGIYMIYNDYFYAGSNKEEMGANNIPKTKAFLYMSSSSFYVQSEETIVSGNKELHAFAVETASFGAKQATFYGDQA